MLPCDLSPSSRASAVCPPTASQASSNASLLMPAINAQVVNGVNARIGNGRKHNPGMGRQAESEGSEFWQRLVEAWKPKGLPTSQNGVADELGKKGNGTTGRWFSGETLPEMDTLRDIALKGNVTVDWLLTGRYPKHPITPGTVLGDLHNAWGEFTDADIAVIAAAIEGRVAVANLRALSAPAKKAQGRK